MTYSPKQLNSKNHQSAPPPPEEDPVSATPLEPEEVPVFVEQVLPKALFDPPV